MTHIVRKDKKTIVGEFMDSKTSGQSSSKSRTMPQQLAESAVKPFPERKVKNV
jgi:hypothetical protein